MRHSPFYFLVVSFAVSCFFDCAMAIESKLDFSEIAQAVRNANILKPNQSIKITGQKGQITALVDPTGKSDEQDLKIDALLISKSIFESSGLDTLSAKILFSNSGKNGRYIVVNRACVSDYSSGKTTAQNLLATVRFTQVQQEALPTVADGPFQERRILVWERIEKLRSAGTGVKPFEKLFNEVEETAKNKESTHLTAQKLSYLEERLTGQEQSIADARKVASGKGMPSLHGSYKGSNNMDDSPALKSLAQNQKLDGSMLRMMYKNWVPQLLSLMQSKNSPDLTRAKELDNEIRHLIDTQDYIKASRKLEELHVLANKNGTSRQK